MKKKIWIMLIFLLLLPIFSLRVYAADSSQIINEQSQKSGASDLYGKTPGSAKSVLQELKINDTGSNALSNFTPSGLFHIIVTKLKEASGGPVKAVLSVFGILLLCALLNTMKNSFGEKPLSTVFNLVCILCVTAALFIPISKCIQSTASTISDSSKFMLTFLPVFVTLVAATGHPASAAATQSLLLISSQVISQIASTTFIPMMNLYLAFCVIGSAAPGIKIGGIASFIRKATDFFLTLSITVFTGILLVQSLIAQAADTVTLKTAKFVVKNAVPVIGSAVSDAVNAVASCANLLKTTTGAFAIIVFIILFLPPIINCLLWILAADISQAAAEMLGIEQITEIFKAVKEALRLLISLVITCALAMIVSVSVLLLLGMNN